MKPLPASIREKNRLNLIALKGKKQNQLFGVTSLLALAACGDEGTSIFRNTTDKSPTVATTLKDATVVGTDKSPTVATALQDATVVGNDTIIDLDGVFGNGNGNLTLTASLGSVGTDDMLILSDPVFTEGTHTITVTATDTDGDTAKETVELTSDKTPTVATIIDNATLAVGNDGTTINVSSVFANGSGVLNITVSTGTITGGMLTLSGAELAQGANTIMLTATDADLINPDSATSIFVITTDKSPTVTPATIGDTIIAADNNGITIDVSGVFGHPIVGETLTLSASTGTITDGVLTLAAAEIAEGTNTITLMATDADLMNPDSVTSTFVLTTDQSPTVATAIADDRRATNHSDTTIDLTTVFASGNGPLTYAVTAPAGVSTANSSLTIDYSTLGAGAHTVTVTATDRYPENADSITDVFVLEVVKLNDNSLGSYASLLGTTYVDAIIDNSFAEASGQLSNINLDGGKGDSNDTISSNSFHTTGNNITLVHFGGRDGNDTISSNSFLATNNTISLVHFDGGAGDDTISNNIFTSRSVRNVTFDGGDGNDTISNNTLTASDYNIRYATFAGGAGDDTISNNTLAVEQFAHYITFDGGDGNDTISNNTITASDGIVRSNTLDGGDGNDTISGNHFESSGTGGGHDIYWITLMGGAGDDVFRHNTAIQANGELSTIHIEGGEDTDSLDTDKVYFELASSMFTIKFDGGGNGSQITVIDDAKRVNAGENNDVNSYAQYVLIDIEELYFDDTLYEFS